MSYALGTVAALTVREYAPGEQERQATIEQARSERETFLVAIPNMTDLELVERLAANQRSYWERVQRGEHVFPESGDFVPLNREYEQRAAQRVMPPIPEPMDVPAYGARARGLAATAKLDELFPRTMYFAPLKSYAANVLQATTGIETDYSRGSRVKAVAITAVPIAAGFAAHRKTGGRLLWTMGAAVGSIYVMSLLVGALFIGAMAVGGGARY